MRRMPAMTSTVKSPAAIDRYESLSSRLGLFILRKSPLAPKELIASCQQRRASSSRRVFCSASPRLVHAVPSP